MSKQHSDNHHKKPAQLFQQLLNRIRGKRPGLKHISLKSNGSDKHWWNWNNLRISLKRYGKHWELGILALLVIISNINLPFLSDNSTGKHSIIELASNSLMEDLGFNQEYTFSLDTQNNDYLFKTAQTETIITRNSRKSTIRYTVRQGESVGSLASDFGLTALTIRYANNLTGNSLKVGQELRVPPVDGLYVTIKKGDTLSSIANHYKVKLEDIAKYNNINTNQAIFAGQEFLIPGAIVSRSEVTTGGGANVPTFKGPSNGKFDWPTGSPTHYLSQNYGHTRYERNHTGIDLNRLNGLGIYASQDGVVASAGRKYNGYGNLIIIKHGDGWETYYAHLSSIKVRVGETVKQGQLIGIMGTTGWSTGVHLHFEVRKNNIPQNPLNYLP